MRLVIFGPQGAGKGTQSARISEKFGVPAISTGDIFRKNISEKTELGLRVLQYVDHGKLVPDEVTIHLVEDRLAQVDCRNGFLIDGFPRNLVQAEALDRILAERNEPLDAALVIEVSEEASLRRLMGRRVCSRCGRNYSLHAPPRVDWTCDSCGGEVVERQDDHDEETIRERLRLYHEQTTPLKQYYADRGKLREVSGEASPDEVFDTIISIL